MSMDEVAQLSRQPKVRVSSAASAASSSRQTLFAPKPPENKKKADVTPAWLAGAAHLRTAALPPRRVAQPVTIGIGAMPALRLPAHLRAPQPPPREQDEQPRARTERSFAKVSRWPRVGEESQTSRDHLNEAINETATMRAAADHRSLDPALLDALEGADDESDAHAIRRLRGEARLLKKREQETRITKARLDRQARRLGMANPRTQRTLAVFEQRGSEMHRLGQEVRTRDATFGLKAMNHERAEAEKAELVRLNQNEVDDERDCQLAPEAVKTTTSQSKAAAAWNAKERNRLLRQVLTGSLKRTADIQKTVTLLQQLVAPAIAPAPPSVENSAGRSNQPWKALEARTGGGSVGFAALAAELAEQEQQKKWREGLAMWEPMLREVEAGTLQYDHKSSWNKATYRAKSYYWKDVNGVLSVTREVRHQQPDEPAPWRAAESSVRYIRSLRSNFKFWEFCREHCCAEGVYNQLEKEQQGVEAQGCKYNALSAWQMAINSTPIVADQPDDVRVYFWRSKDLTFSLKPPKQGVKSVVRSDEDDFNRCWREYVAVLDMTQKLKPETLWPGEPAENYPPEWESKILDMNKRLPELGSAAVVFAMRSAGGHAGQAMKLLQQFWRHYSDLAGEDQKKRFFGATSVAIDLLHIVNDIKGLFQQGEYFKARKACEDAQYNQKHSEVQLKFMKRQKEAHESPDDELAQNAMDEMQIELAMVGKAADRLKTLQASSNKDPAAGLKRVWDTADADNSGDLDIGELKEVLRMMGRKNITQAMLEAVMLEIDEDGSGEIDFEEFEVWYWKQAEFE